jgi:hypothetical protein
MNEVENALTGAEVVPAATEEVVVEIQEEGSAAATEQIEQVQQQGQPRDEKGRYVPQERLNEVTKARRMAERERDALRAELERERQSRQAVATPPPDQPPAPEQFGYDLAKWQQETAKYYADAAARSVDARYREQELQRTRQETGRQFEQKARAFQAETPDYEDRVQFSPEVIDVIANSDHGPALAYHLATHLDEADRIARMSPHLAAVQLGRLEAQVSAPKRKPVTQAPPPAPTLSGGSTAPRGIRAGMSYEQYKAARMGGT